jgi:hypothetical protein
MADLKPPDFSLSTTAPQPKKARPIPRAVTQAIELIATGKVKSIQTAANHIGMERSTLSKRLSRPECIAAMRARAQKEVALGAGRAAARLNELIDSASGKVSIEAVKYSLGVAGIKPAGDAQVNVNLELRAGYVLDLREPDAAPAKVIDHEAGQVIDAKPIE